MKTTMMLLLVFWICILNSSLGMDQDCYERLDVISEANWSALSGFCREILDSTELVAIGPIEGSIHTVVHTTQRRTYIRGRSNLLHLYGTVTRELVEIRGVPVKEIEFGVNFVAILAEDGRLWTAGSNNERQLGHHHLSESYPIFSRVEGLPPVRHIAVGLSHCVALLHNDTLVSWGRNLAGELGYDTVSSAYQSVPTLIRLGQAATPIDVCCGWEFCTALTSNLEVYTWGKTEHIGRPRPNKLPARVVGIPEEETIIKVACGDVHTMTLSAEGVLYGWGMNYGRLQGAPNCAPHATRMNLTGKIARDVTVGDELTIVRTYSTRAEYFGRYNNCDYPQPRTAVNIDFARDLNAKTHYGQRTMGAVLLGCKGNPSCL